MSTYKRVIACLDVADGRVVKGIQFVDLVDAGDPVELAKVYEEQGIDELVFLDINATYENRDTQVEMAAKIAENIAIPFTVGGGIHGVEGAKALFDVGVSKVSVGSAAIENPDLVTELSQNFGKNRIVVAIDAKKSAPGEWEVYTAGGRKPTGLDVVQVAKKLEEKGAGEILLTSMDDDGAQNGFDIGLVKAVSSAVSIPVIASGGVGKLEHFSEGILDGGADGVLAASVFHFGTFSVQEVKEHLRKRNIPIRE